MDDVFDRSPINNPSHSLPGGKSLPFPTFIRDAWFQKVTVHIRKLKVILWCLIVLVVLMPLWIGRDNKKLRGCWNLQLAEIIGRTDSLPDLLK